MIDLSSCLVLKDVVIYVMEDGVLKGWWWFCVYDG